MLRMLMHIYNWLRRRYGLLKRGAVIGCRKDRKLSYSMWLNLAVKMALMLGKFKGFFQWKGNQEGESEGIVSAEEDRLEDTDSQASMTENEDSSIVENSFGQEQGLSVARRLCFAASLLLCVFTVFVFAFLLPCHQPGCHKTNSCPLNVSKDWSVNFTSSIPSGVYFLDATGNRHLDVLVEATKGCEDASCIAKITALRGESGESLWTLWRDTTLQGLLTCSHLKHPSCLLAERSSHLLKIDAQVGSVKWSSITQHTIYAYEFVKDADGDGVQDIVVLHAAAGEPCIKANISIVSGTTGRPLSMPVSIPGKHNRSSILVVYDSSEGMQFILVGSASHGRQPGSLWAISTADLARKMGPDGDDTDNSSQWGPYLPGHRTGFISLFDGIFVLVKPLITDLNSDGVTDLVVCVKDPGLIVVALDGKTLSTLWKMSLSSVGVERSSVGVDRLIAAGMSKGNNHTHIAAIVKSANLTAELWVIDGQSGDVTWSFHSDAMFPVPPVSTHSSPAQHQAFLIWLPGSEAVKYFKDNRQNHRESLDQNSSQLIGRNNGAHYPHYSVTSKTHSYGTDHQKIARHAQNSDQLMNSLDPDQINSGENTLKKSIDKEKRNAVRRDSYQGDGTTPMPSSHHNCGSESSAETPLLSAFLVSHDGTIKVEQVTTEKTIYLDPKEFEGLFGQKLSTEKKCVKLVPRNVVAPVVGDMDGSGEPQLVYAVEYVTEESAGSDHLMKIQKLNIQQAVNGH